MSKYFCEGIAVKNNELVFNYNKDELDDVVYLTQDTSGTVSLSNVDVFYAYQFNQQSDWNDRKKVREYLKDMINTEDFIIDDNFDNFVECAVTTFDSLYHLNKYSVLISTKSVSHDTYTGLDRIGNWLVEYGDRSSFEYTFKLVKQMYDKVQFNSDMVRQMMRESNNYDERKVERDIRFLETQFERLKKTGKLFEMKRIVPTYLRVGFSNFLKFNDETNDREIYESLQGVNVLIYDDFHTTGNTLNEIARYLKSINLNNQIMAFVLVKQH